MCGIIGYVGTRKAKGLLLEGLGRLEYRGYDSAGIALLDSEKKDFFVKRSVGVVQSLVDCVGSEGENPTQGIAHTRWATHGVPSEINAHPHRAGFLILAHNGIIENHTELKHRLSQSGVNFSSQTDTEVFAQLIESHRVQLTKKSGKDFAALSETNKVELVKQALGAAMREVSGHYAILFMVQNLEGYIFGAQNGAPIVATVMNDGVLIASDLQAVIPHSSKVRFVPVHSIFIANRKTFEVFDIESGQKRELPEETIQWSSEKVAKDGFAHFMLKEIHQQPMVSADTLSGRLPSEDNDGFMWDSLKGSRAEHDKIWKNVKRLYLIACGTSYHAALVAKYYFESWARLPVEVDLASEFRYRNPVLEADSLVGVISQSGETADTLAALRLVNSSGFKSFAICNVPGSSIMREATLNYPTKAGPEIGVASTKAFTAQVTVLATLALDAARIRERVNPQLASENIRFLARLPHDMERVLARADEYINFGKSLIDKRTILFMGRGPMYPIALEGALKLKEITYRHAEGYAAGELKHGPLALVDEGLAAIVLAPTDELLPKTLSNLEEIKSRKALVIGVGEEGNKDFERLCDHYVPMPAAPWILAPMLYVVPLQLISYGMALALGREIDKPRNLAKSVTVE